MDFHELSVNESIALFCNGETGIPLDVERIENAALVWRHNRPSKYSFKSNQEFLETCAVKVAKPSRRKNQRCVAYADRYGGGGISENGGSGRAGTVDGLFVKGLGRTPLIGQNTDSAHSSGHAYLEECIREAIFSEIFTSEFPHSAVKALAIIDTSEILIWPSNEVELWPPGEFPGGERQALLVRSPCLRVGHLDRALSFQTADPYFGATGDVRRVNHNLSMLFSRLGEQAALSLFVDFKRKMLEQIAYGAVACLGHNATTASNVTLDGALLDFGAATAFPGWGTFSTPSNQHSYVRSIFELNKIIDNLLHCLGRYSSLSKHTLDELKLKLDGIGVEFDNAVIYYSCLFMGLNLNHAMEVTDGSARTKEFRQRLTNAFALLSNETYRFDYTDNVAMHLSEQTNIWHEGGRPEVNKLRTLALDFVSKPSVAKERANFLSAPRRNLFRESMRRRIHKYLSSFGSPSKMPPIESISSLISLSISEGRRFSSWLPDDSVPKAFAVSDDFSILIFRDPEFLLKGIVEWASVNGADWLVEGKIFEIQGYSSDYLRLSNGEILLCSISLDHI